LIDNDWIGSYDTAVAYYTGKDISALSDIEWCKEVARLKHVRELDASPRRKRDEEWRIM
jgi:hypothetical protein